MNKDIVQGEILCSRKKKQYHEHSCIFEIIVLRKSCAISDSNLSLYLSNPNHIHRPHQTHQNMYLIYLLLFLRNGVPVLDEYKRMVRRESSRLAHITELLKPVPASVLGANATTHCTFCTELLGTSQCKTTEKAIQLPCGHIFGERCITRWLKPHNTCPNCRQRHDFK